MSRYSYIYALIAVLLVACGEEDSTSNKQNQAVVKPIEGILDSAAGVKIIERKGYRNPTKCTLALPDGSRPNTTEFSYDENGRLIKAGSKDLVWDSEGRLTSFNGNEITYDESGRVSSYRISSTGGKSVFSYDDEGQVNKIERFNGETLKSTVDYDYENATATQTNPAGTVITQEATRLLQSTDGPNIGVFDFEIVPYVRTIGLDRVSSTVTCDPQQDAMITCVEVDDDGSEETITREIVRYTGRSGFVVEKALIHRWVMGDGETSVYKWNDSGSRIATFSDGEQTSITTFDETGVNMLEDRNATTVETCEYND